MIEPLGIVAVVVLIVWGIGYSGAQHTPGWSEPHAQTPGFKAGAWFITILMVLMALALASVGANFK